MQLQPLTLNTHKFITRAMNINNPQTEHNLYKVGDYFSFSAARINLEYNVVRNEIKAKSAGKRNMLAQTTDAKSIGAEPVSSVPTPQR